LLSPLPTCQLTCCCSIRTASPAVAMRPEDHIPVMQRMRWLLIGLLLLASASCARRDWVSDLLVLTDVTGTWEGAANVNWGSAAAAESVFPLRWCFSKAAQR